MTEGAVVSVDPTTATLPVAPGSVHSGVLTSCGAVIGQPLAGSVTEDVATSATDGAVDDAVSASEPQAASVTTSEAAQAASATEEGRREDFTVATVQRCRFRRRGPAVRCWDSRLVVDPWGSDVTTVAPVPPFTRETAIQKVRAGENAWNTRDPERVALAYTPDSRWRNRSVFVRGRDQIVEFLRSKWEHELDYRLIKELWAHGENRIAVRFAYEYHDDSGQWYRAYGNENWEFDEHGLMRTRHASINDVVITEGQRLFRWDSAGSRPSDHPGLTELGL